ncbi:hypothetical protein PI125_g9872 [Phytophthora idaei]|nr:hypothetical protein PI125_g9872 [Phytophthora idaei]KAG3152327.1 hypothetical protein PI126_g10571 [Phytophthora idaei]
MASKRFEVYVVPTSLVRQPCLDVNLVGVHCSSCLLVIASFPGTSRQCIRQQDADVYGLERQVWQPEGERVSNCPAPGGATRKNIIIDKDHMEGVHCKQSNCTIQNVCWEDLCEDALSIKGGTASSVTKVIGGGAQPTNRSSSTTARAPCLSRASTRRTSSSSITRVTYAAASRTKVNHK